MKLVPFGRTGLDVSNLCLDAGRLDRTSDARAAFALLDSFCAQGGNFVQIVVDPDDTDAARSQELLGQWMAGRDVMRNELVLSAKLCVPVDAVFTRESLERVVREACDAALRRLGDDHLDVLVCEIRPMVLPLEALLAAVSPLIASGRVGHLGVARFPAPRLRMAAEAEAELPRIAVVQDEYSLVARYLYESGVARACEDIGAAFVTNSPLAGGFLTDEAGPGTGWVSTGGAMHLGSPANVRPRLGLRDAIEQIARARGATVAQTALAWVLGRPGVTAALVGADSAAELQVLIDGIARPLSERDEALLENPVADWVARELEPRTIATKPDALVEALG